MLPDFPAVKEQLNPLLMNFLNKRVREHMGFFGEIPIVPIPEGGGTHLKRADGTTDDTPMEKMQGKISVETDAQKGLSLEEVFRSIDQVAQDMARQEVQLLHRRIDQVTQETGNVVDARAEPLSAKLLNDSLEMMHIPFTDEGEPCLPSIVVHPDVGRDLMARKEELEGDPLASRCADTG